MEGIQPDNVVVAIDIGASKVEIAVADISVPKQIDVIGIGKVPSMGVVDGCIQDIESAVESIRRAVQEASETSGCPITHVTAAFTGKNLHCVNKIGKLVLSGDEITREDVAAATKLAMVFDPKIHDADTDPALKHESDTVVMHSVKGYTIDDDDTMIGDPVGMAGTVLKAHVHLAIGSDSIAVNLAKCVRKAGLDLDGVVMQPWASAESCLTPTEKELGVILIDFGDGAADIACYRGNQIQYTAVAPMGGRYLSRDIASGIGCTLDAAEEIKLAYGHLDDRPDDVFTQIRYTHDATGTERVITAREIVGIIKPRAQEIIEQIARIHLLRDNWLGRAAAGVVITGGMAKMPGFDAMIRKTYGLPVRIGEPLRVRSTRFFLTDPEDATVMGVLAQIQKQREIGEHQIERSRSGIMGFLRGLIYGDFSD